MTIRILIADDHGVVAEGLRSLIQAQADMEVVACVADGREAVRCSIEASPDIVLMDIAMPELNGTEATNIIRERLPDTRVVMLSMYSDPVHVCRALQAGASGYVVKKSAAKEVVDAIRAVHGGQRYLSKPLVTSVIDQFVSKTTSDPLDRLSSRERQVLQMLAEGSSVAGIAIKLSLSPKTVETYRARLMDKLGIHDFASLIKFAIQQGLASFE
ncbi:MAG TPA: response regulator transcription factor [Usitatibacter sp.]|nr:response regulator transcription factor [Usitatibacter sp.]